MDKSQAAKLREKMDFKWRVQSTNQYNCTLVAYIDARDVEDKLDDIIGPENWTNEYRLVGNQMICKIGILTKYSDSGLTWVFKEDGGTESNIEKEKGLLSDSFKRAAVKWGIGRFLYNKKPYKLLSIDSGRKDRQGKPLFLPAHNVKKHGPAQDVPFGLIYDLKINDVNKYINEFLKPFLTKKK